MVVKAHANIVPKDPIGGHIPLACNFEYFEHKIQGHKREGRKVGELIREKHCKLSNQAFVAIISTIDKGAKILSTSVEFGLSVITFLGHFFRKKEEAEERCFDIKIEEKTSDICVNWASSFFIVIEVKASIGYSGAFHYVQRTNAEWGWMTWL